LLCSPTVGFKTKTSWAGLLPIGNQTARELYFWLWGKDDSPSDDLVIWLNVRAPEWHGAPRG